MPAVSSSIIEPIWDQFSALLPSGPVAHPLGCHRPRIAGPCGVRQTRPGPSLRLRLSPIADATCSATTLRRRRDEWIAAGVMDRLHGLVLAAYDRMIGLALGDIAIDCCITKAPCGGEVSGPQPRGSRQAGAQALRRRGRRRHPARWDRGAGQPARFAPVGTDARCTGDRHGPMTVHLDRGYDSGVTRQRLAARGIWLPRSPRGASRRR